MAEPFRPGLYPGVPDVVYHRDPALSSSGARKLAMSSPKEFRDERLRGREDKSEFDFGHLAHKYVLGEGADVEICDFPNWRSNAAQEAQDDARAAGRIPALPKEDEAAREMARIVLEHSVAGPLLAEGEAELSGWWEDSETGVQLKFRTDWMTRINGRLWVPDYKTSKYSGRRGFAKAAGEFGYYMQQPFYTDGIEALGLDDDPIFVFISQCKTPPYVVSVCDIEPADIDLGRALNRHAIRQYAQAQASGEWTDNTNQIDRVTLPAWVRYQAEEILG
ncbi:PD-(D/E)XK nuclease-like domain-containing protein [Nocardia tengchongensis]|uniref:PD-(D/E)XK nuclease-like domain-containing protein n=1 Tax=Nocardia tengchongensis TaxID=2055889 RepID=UPI003612DDD7